VIRQRHRLVKIDVGNLGKKYAATVNKIGAVSPETLPIDKIKPVIMLEMRSKYDLLVVPFTGP
jgi:hypothetical protein